MMKLKIGDSVELIEESLKGHITGINGNRIVMLTEEGFEREVHSGDIIKTSGYRDLEVTPSEIARALVEKEDLIKKKKSKEAAGKQKDAFMEIDLHIHELTDSTHGMDNYDMLSLQLETARRKLEYAMEKRIRRLVFIHGVGEGVLKTELEELFRRYKNISWYDADYRKYGEGATEVYIYQNY